MIARKPLMLKLQGERRMITVLFTDLEGFTSLTERSDPESLVALLDAYFEGVVSRVLAHGGTVDKIVGDAVHAFFNAPIDTPDHVEAAIACAEAIAFWSNNFRKEGVAGTLGLGQTRIGVETGQAIVGDVGVRAKLDYTAHGYPVNAAARLEAANKLFGSQICVGPQAAKLARPGRLLPLGLVSLRGLAGEAQVYSPAP
jgi:adenylate cyclase